MLAKMKLIVPKTSKDFDPSLNPVVSFLCIKEEGEQEENKGRTLKNLTYLLTINF